MEVLPATKWNIRPARSRDFSVVSGIVDIGIDNVRPRLLMLLLMFVG